MASIKQLSLGIGYYTQAIGVFMRLRKYLKQDFIRDLSFPNQLEQEYYYNSKYYNRTKQYMHANHFFGELLCILRGEKMNHLERKRFANLSACAPIFDDFFDKDKEELSKIKDLLNLSESVIPTSEEQKLAVLFLDNILTDIENESAFMDAANQLFEAQLKAKVFQNKEANADDLWMLSKQKGGYSGLMYALLLSHKLTLEEQELAFELGAFGQFMDDVFDLYDDRNAGIFTMPNTAKSVLDIDLFFEDLLSSIKAKVLKYKVDSQVQNDFINVLHIFSAAIRLALQDFKKVESKFDISPSQCLNIDRKYWIIDMEKSQNAFKMFRIGLSYLS